jgi:serine/threonine protein kinase
MGEVYRAIDINLKRTVALKVLPEAVATDPERLARFQREAEVLAKLNHPNIAQIHGLEKKAGTTALVMELVEGPTLADRLAQDAIPVEEALLISRQIAEALEAAHEQGIIHRDLKPANIKVRPDGAVKVLDFGLAKLIDVSPRDEAISQVMTVARSPMTRSGVIVGTVAYMSPEQAKGERVDARADIWALGCVLYEMLTGRAAFEQQTIAETLGRILAHQPAWDALPPDTPSSIRRLLRRSLEKDPRRRLHAAADVRIDIEDASETDAVTIAPPRRRTSVVAFGVVSVAIVAALAVAWSTTRSRPPEVASLRLDLDTAPTYDPV